MESPSYHSGFAPRDGEPLYPYLSDGCVFAAAPCLGPTGLALYDWSPYKRNGTLTNMTAADDWTVNGGLYALDFDGSNDHVVIPDNDVIRPAALSVAAWVFCTSAASGSKTGGVIYSFSSTTPSGNDWSLSESNGAIRFSSGSTYYGGGLLSRNTWTHLAFTRSGSGTLTLYVNGVAVSVGGGLSLGGGWTAGTAIGRWFASADYSWQGGLDDLRVYQRELSPSLIRILARRRGIAYEIDRSSYLRSPGTNRRRRVLIGA